MTYCTHSQYFYSAINTYREAKRENKHKHLVMCPPKRYHSVLAFSWQIVLMIPFQTLLMPQKQPSLAKSAAIERFLSHFIASPVKTSLMITNPNQKLNRKKTPIIPFSFVVLEEHITSAFIQLFLKELSKIVFITSTCYVSFRIISERAEVAAAAQWPNKPVIQKYVVCSTQNTYMRTHVVSPYFCISFSSEPNSILSHNRMG